MKKKIYIKKLQHKGQAVNYWNKMRDNDRIKWAIMSRPVGVGCYIIKWCYR